MLFDELGLVPEILESVEYMGFRETTPVQGQAIPVIMSGRDLIACAQTGTGKTAAFLLPVLNSIFRNRPDHTHTLILVPTRELAIQIDRHILGLAYTLDITSIAIYGGGDGSTWDQEKSALTTGADIIVATPGRLISHLNQGYVKFGLIEVLVLDEADRMLDIGFHDDIMRIISYLPVKRQTLMFSATMPSRIRDLSRKIMKDPASIALEISKPAEGVSQSVYFLGENQKLPLVRHIIKDNPDYRSILIFSSTRKKVSEITRGLRSDEYLVEGISSDLEQKAREDILARFSSRKSRVLVATDVLSRGIDITDISMVINFDAPSDAEDYVHRVGRTARAEKTGMAVTLITSRDMSKIQQIEKLIGYRINRMELPDSISAGNRDKPHEDDRTMNRNPGFRKKRFQKGKKRSTGSSDKNRNMT